MNKLYGDTDLLANKLKVELKSIKPKAKKDQDIIIELVTDVNNIVLRLKALKVEQMLVADSDFLSPIFRVLPSTCQDKWLEFDKEGYSSKWEAFFLDKARDKDLQSKVLLDSYEDKEGGSEKQGRRRCGSLDHKAKRCPEIKAHNVDVRTDEKSKK